ncbi:hypothetical protein [Streptomyces sp. NPDC091383]|uniref:hypothetical protein n=1 Tax=Streptomyces sp. NPDC091383 TaxID=3365996 RepID=UPI0038088B10
MNLFETTPPAPFNVDTATKAISAALIGFVRISLDPSVKDDRAAGDEIIGAIKDAILVGSSACAEVKRLQDVLAAMRNRHQPRPHLDPSAPGALCAACSLHGALITWPCDTWKGADHALTHGQH